MTNSNYKMDYIRKHQRYSVGMEALIHMYDDSQPDAGWGEMLNSLYRLVYQLSDGERIAMAQALTISATMHNATKEEIMEVLNG